METGIKDAKNNLSKLVQAAFEGEEVYLTKRGKRVAQLIPATDPATRPMGRGMWKGKVNLYPGWDSWAEDSKIEEMFEVLREED